eukprot:g1632.t1
MLLKRLPLLSFRPFVLHKNLTFYELDLESSKLQFYETRKCSTNTHTQLDDVFREAPEFDHLSTDLKFSPRPQPRHKLGPNRKLISPSIPSPLSGVLLLEELYRQNLHAPTMQNSSLMRILTHESVLYRGYVMNRQRVHRLSRFINSDRRNAINRVNRSWVIELSRLLRSWNFSFMSEQKLPVKLASGKHLQLAVPSLRDEIILDSVRLILEGIYEPRFSNFSYGFRPDRGRQKALLEIRNRYRGMDYFIVGNLTHAVQQLRGVEMVKLTCKEIHDLQFERLLFKALDIGYISTYGVQEESFLSIDREKGISPLVMNIYLNTFDKWMENYMERSNPSSSRYSKIRYLRHGANFFIGVCGNQEEAKSVERELKGKLVEMKFDPNNFKVETQQSSNRVLFLGYEISQKEVPTGLPRSLSKFQRLQTRPALNIPTIRLRDSFLENGFIKFSKLKTWIPFGVGNIAHWPVDHIVRYYDRLTSGLLEYYALADNYKQLSWFAYLLKRSCNLSIGRKLRLTSMRKVFRKYGRDLTVKDGEKVIASLPDRSITVRPIVNELVPDLTPYLRRRQHITRR